MCAGGVCEAAVTVSTRCGWAKLRDSGELPYGRRFPLKLKDAFFGLCKAINAVWKGSMVPEGK